MPLADPAIQDPYLVSCTFYGCWQSLYSPFLNSKYFLFSIYHFTMLFHNLCSACKPIGQAKQLCASGIKHAHNYCTGDLCDNIGLIGVSAKWSYVTASPCHHDQAIPISPSLLFMYGNNPIFFSCTK